MDFKTAFNIVYGRDPLPSDASKSMYDQGASVIAAAQAIQETTEPSTVDKTSSEEAINQLYLDEFGRPASQKELNYHIDRFGAELDAQESADLTGELVGSVGDTTTAEAEAEAEAKAEAEAEAETKAGDSSEDKVGVTEEGVKRLYENVLLRDPNDITQGELDYYTGKTRADILKGFRDSKEFFGPRAIKQVYQQVVGRAPNAQEVGYHMANYGERQEDGTYAGNVSSLEKRDLADQLRGEQLDNFNRQLGIAAPLYGAGRIKRQDALDFSNFNKAPTNAGISRLRPIPNYGKNTAENITRLYQAETGRTPNQEEIDFYADLYGENIDPSEVLQFRQAPESQTFGGAATQQPFTAPTDVLQRVAYDPEAEGVGPTMADVFGYEAYNPITSPDELAAQDRRATDIAAFTGDERMGAGQVLSNVLGIDPVTGAELEAQVDDGTYTGLDVGDGMYGGGLATLYNKGGKVDNVGLEGLGQKMAAYGRYGDTMLAHISPEEAQMLKAMGGSGTINPVTGLPEFFIKKLFKSIKRILKPVYKAVKPIIPYVLPPHIGIPLAAADAGFTDGKFDIKKAAVAAAKVAASNKLQDAVSGTDSFSAFKVDPTAQPGGVPGSIVGPPTSKAVEAGFSSATRDPSTFESLKQGFSPSSMKEGIKESFGFGDPGTSPVAKVGDLYEGAKGIYKDPAKAKKLIGPSSAFLGISGIERGMEEAELLDRNNKAIIAAYEDRKKKYRDLAASLAKQYPYGYAQGGVANLSGRYLDGAGDGMSDSILANIEGQQEARLADGEFVIPADVVADMGNGSSNAGAERLYAMMDRIRQARHGTTKQPPEVNVNKVMPA